MKTKSLICHYAIALSAILMMITTSCSKSGSELLEYVPADATLVANVDLVQILENAGCQVDDYKITLSQELRSDLEDAPEKAQMLYEQVFSSGCIELDNIVYYQLSYKNKGCAILKVNDQEALDALLSKIGIEKRSQGEYNIIMEERKHAIIQKNNIIFYLYGRHEYDDISFYINGLIANAENNPITSVDWRMDILTNGNDCNLTIAMPDEIINEMPSDIKNVYKCITGKDFNGLGLAYSVDLDGSSIKLTSSLYDKDGEKLNFDNLCDDIDTDFLDYVSKENLFVAAAGIKSDINWQPIVSSYMEMLDEDDSSLSSVITNYLNMADGTIAIAAGPKAGMMSFTNPSTDNWAVTLMAKIKEEKQDELFNTIKSLLQKEADDSYNNVTVTEVSDKMLSYEPGKDKFYIGIKDGYIIASTDMPEDNGRSIYSSSDFSGTAIARLQLEPSNFLMTSFDLRCGVDCVIKSDSNEGVMEITLSPEEKTPFLETVINRISKGLPNF